MTELPLDKMGNPYTPMSEAEKQVHRTRTFDFGPMLRTRQMIERQPVRETTYKAAHPEDVRSKTETMGQAIKRQTTKRRMMKRGK